eukprot:TRINITY_DN17318_c0_g2_i1.p1 TRINITY_DN17318_c0_g2~~TRINITY_DN17318_c0_g2_i1.p1  ORF type:complete len:821 (+),score=324.45 TRINITY_DN17318_c0_g2_i1:73-2535(+)
MCIRDRAEGEAVPDYARPTIFQKLKDKQLLRIKDNKAHTEKVEDIITTHNEENQNLRLTRADRFAKSKRLVIRGEDFKDMCEARRRKAMQREGGVEGDPQNAHEIKVKAANSKQLAKQKRTRRAILTSAEDENVVVTFLSVLNDVIHSVLSIRMEHEEKEEIQEYKEYEDNRGLFLVKHVNDRDPNEIGQVFEQMLERSDEFARSLGMNAVDFPVYMDFVVMMFQELPPFSDHFAKFINVVADIGNKLLNFDPQISELYFLEYGLPALAPLLCKNAAKCNELSYILACYIPASSAAYIRLIHSMRFHIKPFDAFIYALAKLISYGSVDVDEALYTTCFQEALNGFQTTSPVTRTKALTLLEVLSHCDFRPMLQALDIVDKLAADYYWESRAQVVILATNVLEALNQLAENKDEDKKEMRTIKEEERVGETQMEDKTDTRQEDKKDLSVQSDHEATQVLDTPNNKRESTPAEPADKAEDSLGGEVAEDRGEELRAKAAEDEKGVDEGEFEREERKEGEGSEVFDVHEDSSERKQDDNNSPVNIEDYKEAEGEIFSILYKVFNEDTPIITQKVGLIYTARILKYYKDFSKHYLQILLKVPEKVRANVLDVKPIAGTEEDAYVIGVYTQKYKTFGAPLEWCSLYVASELESFIRENELKFLEHVHIQVFQACLVQDFSLDDVEEWLSIFQSLKRYFFIALCDRELCYASIQILKKFFCHPNMQQFVLENTKDVFVKTLILMYNPDRDLECKERNREFLEFLHDFDPQNDALREFVYTIIKNFALAAKKAYDSCNLILLMNRIVEERRGEIFQHAESSEHSKIE